MGKAVKSGFRRPGFRILQVYRHIAVIDRDVITGREKAAKTEGNKENEY